MLIKMKIYLLIEECTQLNHSNRTYGMRIRDAKELTHNNYIYLRNRQIRITFICIQ
jgi:hypothetical protein